MAAKSNIRIGNRKSNSVLMSSPPSLTRPMMRQQQSSGLRVQGSGLRFYSSGCLPQPHKKASSEILRPRCVFLFFFILDHSQAWRFMFQKSKNLETSPPQYNDSPQKCTSVPCCLTSSDLVILSHTMYELNSFRKSSSQQNRQHVVSISIRKPKVDNFVRELTFQNH